MLRQRFIGRVAVQTIPPDPRSAVQFDHEREWSAAARREEPRQQGLITVSEIFHVGDVHVIGCLCTGGHGSLLSLMGHRLCVGVGYTVMGLPVKPRRRSYLHRKVFQILLNWYPLMEDECYQLCEGES